MAGWAKGDSAPLTGNRKFGLMVSFYHTDGSSADKYIPFNPDTDSTESWQYLSGPVVADKAYSEIYVRCVYDYNVNTVYFDGIQLYREEFGNTYAYDKKTGDGSVS